MKTEPIRTLYIPIVLACVAAAGQAFVDGANTRGIVVAVIGALVLAAQELGRRYVTPTGRTDERGQVDPLYLVVVVLIVVILVYVLLDVAR